MSELAQSDTTGRRAYTLRRAALVSSLALGLALAGSSCREKQPAPPESATTYTPAPEITATYIPVPEGEHSNALQAYLTAGHCSVAVAIWGETDRQPARAYVKTNGQPTAKCPSPDVSIVITCDPVTTGEVMGSDPARVIIRYAFFGGACESPSIRV